MEKTDYPMEPDPILEASEPVAAYGIRDTHGWSFPELATQQDVPQEEGRMELGVTDERRAATRAEWSRENFDKLMAEAEKKYGYERGHDYTVEQYFGILSYIVEKGYEAVPED